MTDIGIRDISVSFRDNKISNISLVQGDALTRGFDITFVNAKGETLPVDDDYIVELVAVNSKDKDTPYACRHEIVDDKYRVMIPPEALSESGSVTIQLVFYQKSTKAVIHTIKQKCPVYQSIGQEFVESNNLYVDITALRLGLEKIEKLDSKYEEIIEKDMEIQNNETIRKEAEKKRNLEEVIRKDNEAIRKSNEEKREQLKTALIELKNSTESDLESINLAVDDIISSEDDRKQNEIIREEIKVELENLVADIQNKLDDGDFVGEKGDKGDKGEQGLKGDKGDPGEVTLAQLGAVEAELTAHKEEYANQRQQDQFKVATVEKELNDYKSTMANVNVNQEAKQKVTGYGTISLPKNAANGQVSVSLKGETRTNVFDYTKISPSSNITLISNGIRVTNSYATSAGVRIKNFLKPNTTYTIRADVVYVEGVSTDGVASGRISAIDEKDSSNNFTILPESPTTTIGKVNTFTTKNNIENYELFFYGLSDGVIDFKNIIIEEGNTVGRYISTGTKSTIGASRLKSVDKDGLQESTSYLPNVGELRSLPNGVCDEVRVSSGKGEHIKRVSDDILLGNLVGWQINSDITTNYFALQRPYDDIIPLVTLELSASNVRGNLSCINTYTFVGNDNFVYSYANHSAFRIKIPKTGIIGEFTVEKGITWLQNNQITLTYQLAEPITTPIEVNGTLLSYPSGTVYVEKVLPVAGIYTGEITIAHTDFPISSLDKISKIDFATGVETQLDVSKAVVATDKLSFTHTDLTSGDVVFFEYFYANESTQGELELEYYDSRHVLKDSVTGKFYKIMPTVANGVLTNGLLEV